QSLVDADIFYAELLALLEYRICDPFIIHPPFANRVEFEGVNSQFLNLALEVLKRLRAFGGKHVAEYEDAARNQVRHFPGFFRWKFLLAKHDFKVLADQPGHS